MLAIEGAVVTIDAMGTQKAIAAKIIAKKADYMLAVKENQVYKLILDLTDGVSWPLSLQAAWLSSPA